MRQFLFGLVVAALVFWAWPTAKGAAAETPREVPGGAGAGEADPGKPASRQGSGGPDLAGMMTAAEAKAPAEASPKPADRHPEPMPLNAAGRTGPPADVAAAFERLVAQIQQGDAAAREQARRLVDREDLWPEHRARLQRLLGLEAAAPPPDDVDAVLALLGADNSFLRTAEGRRLGGRVLELARNVPDEKAVAVLTGLLERCMRGSITKADAAAHEFVDQAYAQHRVFADRFLCDPANLSKARSHTVAKGDSLGKIAKSYRSEGILLDEGSLAILNRIHNPNAIQVGQRIRVPIEPLHAVVEKRSFLMAVYLGDSILRLYWVGHGLDGKTPVAEFRVAEKLKDPDWYAPDGGVYAAGSPQNILGRYFVKFEHPSYTGFGAHGTPMPETVGTESSMGCIRMYDKDIEEVYRLLPRGAKVAVRDSH